MFYYADMSSVLYFAIQWDCSNCKFFSSGTIILNVCDYNGEMMSKLLADMNFTSVKNPWGILYMDKNIDKMLRSL